LSGGAALWILLLGGGCLVFFWLWTRSKQEEGKQQFVTNFYESMGYLEPHVFAQGELRELEDKLSAEEMAQTVHQRLIKAQEEYRTVTLGLQQVPGQAEEAASFLTSRETAEAYAHRGQDWQGKDDAVALADLAGFVEPRGWIGGALARL
jgi:hypothetical protein